jgi:GT2 family glycosyltransferase
MQPRVTAILVARNGADYLERTLSCLQSQTRRPEALVLVDAGSSDATPTMLAEAQPTQLVTTSGKVGFGASVGQAIHVAVPSSTEDDWIWLLSHDSAPHPQALASLLGAVEIAPSVAIAGPKLMRWDTPDTIARYGETMTRLGSSVILVENELDQAQYDAQSDLLAVSAAGMLVRQSVWAALGGFDPGLPSVDAALDFSIRARLAGHRVVGVPAARVASAGGPEMFGRKSVSIATSQRLGRRAQLHRRMVYARGLAVLVNWLALVPIGVLRAVLQLIRKQPSAMGGEITAAFGAAFSGSVGPARRNLRRTRKLGWASIAPLRVSAAEARERRANRAVTVDDDTEYSARSRASFISGGGLGITVFAAIIGVLTFSPLLGAASAAGGALLPLSQTVGQLWANVGYGWHDVGGGFVGASDPFAAVLAVLGSLTFWAPSLSIVILYLIALPVAAMGAWWCATRLSERAWPPAIAAVLWCLAPPFLSSMTSGHLGAVIVHVLLPWFVRAVLLAARSWSAGAAAALLFAVIAACSPSVVPALAVLLLAWIIVRPTAVVRLVGIVIPAAALFAPLVIAQIIRGDPLAVFADPGAATPSSAASVGGLLLGSPDATLGGWSSIGNLFDLAALPGPVVLALLLAPLFVLALAATFLPGTRRSVPAIVIALLGFATAVAATHLSFAISGVSAVSVWPGAGLSLLWAGLVGAIVVALDTFGRGAVIPALVVAITATLAAAPLAAAPLAGHSKVVAGSGVLAPAFVAAESLTRPRIGTLALTPEGDGGLGATVERGAGATLDDQSTLASTSLAAGSAAASNSTASLAANLASRSGFDTSTALTLQKVGFILLGPADSAGAQAVRQRAADALNGNRALTPVGDTALGLLWRFGALPSTGLASPTPDPGPLRTLILVGLGIVFFVTLLFAIPTRGRRRRTAVRGYQVEHANLGEDDDA